MRLPVLPALLSLMMLSTPAIATAQDDAPRIMQTDALMGDYQGQVPGAALLILREGEPAIARHYGLADLEEGRAVTGQTHFRLASVSKQFTAMAVLVLQAEGRLSIDDRLARWLPGLPPATATVTLRHLLDHSSGLIDYEDVLPDGLDRQLRDADVLDMLKSQDRTYFTPGQGYRYSNSAYALLALVVEKASGLSYPDFLRQRLFLPLGMAGTHARTDEGPAIMHRAYGYSRVDGHWQRTDQSLTSAVLGDGGIYSATDDLARWLRAMATGQGLPVGVTTLASTPSNTVHGETDVSHYGMGLRLGPGILWHSGESIGFRNVMIRFPEAKMAIVLLSNRNDPEPYALARKIAALWGAPAP